MEVTTCKTCGHFHQHYALNQYHAVPINCGHCTYPRLKSRKANAAGCQHYTPAEAPPDLPHRDRVIQFLTTKILQHILDLEIPPAIAEEDP